jgi:hypothetical protein
VRRETHGVGFQHLRFALNFGQSQALSTQDLRDIRRAIIRQKRNKGLDVQEPFSVAFSGYSMIRASIELPANEDLKQYLHDFAFDYPTLDGLLTVMIAVTAGLFFFDCVRQGHALLGGLLAAAPDARGLLAGWAPC